MTPKWQLFFSSGMASMAVACHTERRLNYAFVYRNDEIPSSTFQRQFHTVVTPRWKTSGDLQLLQAYCKYLTLYVRS